MSREEVKKAIEYYRDTEKGYRNIKAMNHAYRWIKTDSHMKKLRKFEKDEVDFFESRTNLLKLLSTRLYKIVK